MKLMPMEHQFIAPYYSTTVLAIYIKSLQKRLLKVCYVPATSAHLPRHLFFAEAINSTNKGNKTGSRGH